MNLIVSDLTLRVVSDRLASRLISRIARFAPDLRTLQAETAGPAGRGPNGPVDLSSRGFDLMCVLLDRAGDIVSKDAIFDAVWPGVVVEENTLQVHVSALRKALGADLIATVHGRGCRYAGPMPVELGADAPKARAGPRDRKPVIVVLPFETRSLQAT